MAASGPHRPVAVDDAIALVRAHCPPLATETLPLPKALGRGLRQDVLAPEDQPPFDRSAVDGYAVRSDDASVRFRVVEQIRAGDWKRLQLKPGQAAQIATGAALRGQGWQVLMKEDVRRQGGEIVVVRRGPGSNIRLRGEDARAGALLVKSGTRLGPGALALLAGVGCVRPRVTALPRVLHVATGDEIVPPGQRPSPGQIRDSNSTLVRAFLAQWGIPVEQVRCGEEEALPKPEIRNPKSASNEVDLLLVSGGASVGEHDFTAHLLERAGYRIRLRRTSARPGRPLIFATGGSAVAFGLPGNPLAHFVCLNLYVRTALHGWSGATEPDAFARGVLARNLKAAPSNHETLWPARMTFRAGAVEVEPLPWRSSGDLTALAKANALVRIPAGCGRLARGAGLAFLPTAPG